MEWHATQLTRLRAWLLLMRPACAGWLRWQARHSRSASAGFIDGGLRISAALMESMCLLPGPWQDSQARVSKPRFLSVSTAWCGFLAKALLMSSWQAAHISEPMYSAGLAGAGTAG